MSQEFSYRLAGSYKAKIKVPADAVISSEAQGPLPGSLVDALFSLLQFWD